MGDLLLFRRLRWERTGKRVPTWLAYMGNDPETRFLSTFLQDHQPGGSLPGLVFCNLLPMPVQWEVLVEYVEFNSDINTTIHSVRGIGKDYEN